MPDPDPKIRVLAAKPGLDGHDRGAKVIARALRDAGTQAIYTGLRQTPEMIAEAALQEDVSVVGLSILSGAHMALVPRILELLRANGLDDVSLFLGGIIPDEDVPALKAMGVAGIRPRHQHGSRHPGRPRQPGSLAPGRFSGPCLNTKQTRPLYWPATAAPSHAC